VTVYSFVAFPGGPWTDANDWDNLTTGKTDDGVPGPNDTATLAGGNYVDADGATVGALDAGSGTVIGDVTVKGTLTGGNLEGGNVTVGSDDGSTFTGKSLTAGTIYDAADLKSGTVKAKLLANAIVDGSVVTADRIAGGPAGVSEVIVNSGSLTAGTLTLTNPTTLLQTLTINGGTTTITGAASCSDAPIQVNGGTADFKSELSLEDYSSLAVGSETASALAVTVSAGDLVAGTGGSIAVNSGSSLTVSGDVTLGDKGAGTLGVVSGATLVVDGDVTGGSAAGSMGTMGIDGAGAVATIDGEVQIGVAGEANFGVGQAASATIEGAIVLGAGLAGNGGLTVSDAGSKLTLGGAPVTVGDAGNGGLIVQNGAVIAASSSNVTVAAKAGSTGGVGVTSAGSKLTVRSLTVGEGGRGTLNLSDGGILSVAEDLVLGEHGNGTFFLSGGATLVVEGEFAAAKLAGSSASAMISDAGAVLTIHGEWQIGVAGTATETIEEGVAVDAEGGISLGVETTGVGSLTVAGSGTLLTVGVGGVEIGDAATGMRTAHDRLIPGGTMTLESGAVIDAAASSVTIADQAKSTGSLTVTESGSQFEADALTVGGAGTASLTVSNGASLMVAADLTLGDEAAGKGTATIASAALSVGGDTTIGAKGRGILVGELAALDLGGGMVTLGEEAKSKGYLTVDGGSLAMQGELLIGDVGGGTVFVGGGAKLAPAAGAKAPDIALGKQVGATGSLTVTGQGSSVSGGSLEVGALGKATISVTLGGKLFAASADVATEANAKANAVKVDSGGYFGITTDLTVGENGVGTLSITGAGQVAALGDVSIAEGIGAIGSVTVSGKVTNPTTKKTVPSSLGFGGTLEIGGRGSAMLSIQNGALAAPVPKGKGIVEIGAEKGGSGTITLSGAGSTLKGSELAVGGTATEAAGAGRLTIGSKTTVGFATATVWTSGKVSDKGTLAVAGDVGGDGVIHLETGGTFDLGGGDKDVGVAFEAGTGETLSLAAVKEFDAKVSGFGPGDTIALLGVGVKRKSFADGILSLSDGAKLAFSGSYKLDNFRFVRIGKNTDITWQKGSGAGAAETHRDASFVAFGAAAATAPAASIPRTSLAFCVAGEPLAAVTAAHSRLVDSTGTP
jgi:T5SS/PEP-CTERM-associated repeat protein